MWNLMSNLGPRTDPWGTPDVSRAGLSMTDDGEIGGDITGGVALIDKAVLIPFGWQWCVGWRSRLLHRHVAVRLANLHLSAAGKTAVWQHEGGRTMMKQGNLKGGNQSFWWTKQIDSLQHIHLVSCCQGLPQMADLMLLCISISSSHTQSPVTPTVWSRVLRSSASQQTPSCSPGM